MKLTVLLLALFASAIVSAQTASVTIRWTAPTENIDGTPVTANLTYNVYAALKGATKTKIATSTTGASTTVQVAPGTCFEITAVAAGAGESARSTELCMLAIPKPPSGVVFVTIQVG